MLQLYLALTRAVPRSIERCELTHLAREPIDFARAVAQHDAYEAALASFGCQVERLPGTPDLPDSVFVEDTAIVLDALAIVTRPGAESRRAEVETVAARLREVRPLVTIQSPGTLDGGDVLVTRSACSLDSPLEPTKKARDNSRHSPRRTGSRRPSSGLPAVCTSRAP